MTRFNLPSETDLTNRTERSPNGRYIIVVTSRGIESSTKVESTIWLLEAKAIQTFLDRDSETATRPVPMRHIATIAGVPDIMTYDTYGAVITDLKWSEDSSKLYFLAIDELPERRLYEVDLPTGKLNALTPVGFGVRQYVVSGRHIAYTANRTQDERPEVPWDHAHQINHDVGAVTGLGLEEILFPQIGQGSGNGRLLPDLWVGHGHRFQHVPNAEGEPTLDVEHYTNALSISPDGRRAVRLLPIFKVNPSWSRYQTKPGFESWKLNPADDNLVASFYKWRLREYMLVDTATGKTRPLIDAPHGSSLAEEDASLAVWSRDGKHLLLGNVALPLTGDSSENQRLTRTCALAIVDLPSYEAHCIAPTRDASAVIAADNPHPLRLQDATLGEGNEEVIANFAWHGRWGQTERYRLTDGGWSRIDVVPGNPIDGKAVSPPEDAVRLTIEQDLNTPPTLWASFHGRKKQLWNPNPQLANVRLGKASIFHWRDKTGYDWDGVLVLPVDYESGKRYPLVIQTHGYRPSIFVTDGLYPTAMAARPLSSAGFVVLQTDNRADHFVSPQEPLDAIEAWESAISKLDANGLIDSKRVGIIGFSRTCWYVEEALVHRPRLFAAATVADGLDISYVTYRLFGEGRQTMAKEYEKIIGTKPVGKDFQSWFDISPGFHLDQVQTPLRIEAIGPPSVLTEWELYASLRAQHKPVDMIYLPYGQHVLQRPLDRSASQQGNVDWFRFWLQSYEDPDPTKKSQYQRWEALRKTWN